MSDGCIGVEDGHLWETVEQLEAGGFRFEPTGRQIVLEADDGE